MLKIHMLEHFVQDDVPRRQTEEDQLYCQNHASVQPSPDTGQEKFKNATQDLFELLERVQCSRLDDQRCVLPPYFSQTFRNDIVSFRHLQTRDEQRDMVLWNVDVGAQWTAQNLHHSHAVPSPTHTPGLAAICRVVVEGLLGSISRKKDKDKVQEVTKTVQGALPCPIPYFPA
ncbi:hypothetical protein LSTR_LSTR004696 [Laodelphax striatellus]|uniref:Uncharacterized protein n=1 Tax=Laodelphax striatellus TaxID=195883 RepID=A0A482WU62_LAOST|nr:hypothetical protein LSTR_LSTR004696 [Laodelphax striatellus]